MPQGVRVRVPLWVLRGFPTSLIEAAMRRLKAVAIRTEDPEVLDSVVVPIAVDVIDLDWDPTAGCLHPPSAELACGPLEANAEQSKLQAMAAGPSIGDKNLVERHCRSRVKLHSRVPALTDEVS